MNCKKLLPLIALFISFFIHTSSLIATDDKYPVIDIPDSLKVSANAVIRNEEIQFELESIKDGKLRISYAITILNKNGLYKSYFVKPYDQFSKVKDIKGAVYDASGKFIKRFKQDDIEDYSANSGGSLFLDSRVKAINPTYLKYPFTVEYSCEIDYNGLLNYPYWQIYRDYNVSVERSVFSVKWPVSLEIRTLERAIDVEPTEKTAEGFHSSTWEVHNLKAIKNEPLSNDLSKVSPKVILAPSDFLIDGYQGNCESWENFGSWIYTLNEGKGNLSEETKQKILTLTSAAETDYEKAKILYQYLQDNTRYVSVQIGIGGWQPIEADAVDRLSYGDCKALTNYMRVLLEIADIESYYVLVRAGSNTSEIISEFPSNQFNHAILCAPIENDTVWLECTSQRLPFGYIGSFTDDRDVVLINKDGGKLVRTKAYTSDDNQKVCNAQIDIDEYGDGTGIISTKYRGLFYDEKLPVLVSDEHDQKKRIRQDIKIPNFVLEEYELNETRQTIPSIDENITVNINGCGSKFGNRMAFNLNTINKLGNMPPKKEKRRSDIVVRRSMVEIDTVVYVIPNGYEVEKVSKNREVISEFGELKTSVTVHGSELHYSRYLLLNKGTYPAESYNQFYEFYNLVKKGDNDRAILVKVGNSIN